MNLLRSAERTLGTTLLLGPLGAALWFGGTRPPVGEPSTVCGSTEVSAPGPVACMPPFEPDEVVETAPEPEAPVAVERTPAFPFAFVNTAGLVLHLAADPAWGIGPTFEFAGPGQFGAAKKADPSRLPAELRDQLGRTFDLYAASTGRVCQVTVEELFVVAQHDGPDLYSLMEAEAQGIEWSDFHEGEIPPRTVQAKVWAEAVLRAENGGMDEWSGTWLVANIGPDPACGDAMWARDASLPAPLVLTASEVDTSRFAERVAAFEGSSRFVETRRGYEEWRAGLDEDERQYFDTWKTEASQAPTRARAWTGADGETRILELTFGLDAEACSSDPGTRLWTIEQLAPGSVRTLEDRAPDAEAVFDLDGDGQFEFLYAGEMGVPSLLESHDESLASSWDLPRVFYCPC